MEVKVLINRTKGVVICDNIISADSPTQKAKGLIGSNGAQGLLLKTRWGVHTFGMKFPIDIIVLNKKNIVVGLKKNLKPNRWHFWNPIYSKIIEVPSSITENNIDMNNELELKNPSP